LRQRGAQFQQSQPAEHTVRTERGREIRKAFVPRNEEFTLLSADYSQIELRIIASMSRDEAMIEAFRNGWISIRPLLPIYTGSLPRSHPRPAQKCKERQFRDHLCISAFGLSENLGIARKEAAEIIEQYFNKFPGIKA
jgi:DNA polymerase-1